jgi:tRNA(Ile)-lysidine synthase
MLKKSTFNYQLENLVHQPEKRTYLLAVSGGADSMVLASLFLDLRNRAIPGMNFRWLISIINFVATILILTRKPYRIFVRKII